MRAVALGALALLLGCQGIGRPIVGVVPEVDGGETRTCEVGPACRALRQVEEDRFSVPTSPRPIPALDCDGDSIDDAVDNCLGVPNAAQGLRDCDATRTDCERLERGDLDIENADLRGCRLDDPIEVSGVLSLRGALLACSDIAWTGPADALVDLSEATVTSSLVRVTNLSLDIGRTTFRSSALSTVGSSRVSARGSIFDQTSIFVSPTGEVVEGAPSPTLDATGSDFAGVTIHEPPSSRPARIRIEGSSISTSTFHVQLLDLFGVTVSSSALAAVELDAQEVDVSSSAIRTARGAFASSRLTDVIFEGCTALRLSDSAVSYVDVPACPPEAFRAFRTEFIDCNVAGGLELVESRYMAGLLGGGPASTLVSRASEIDGVRFCELGAAAFLDGAIRCVSCDEHAFMDGVSVCVSGSSLFERGCPAIELALSCE